MNRTTTQIKDHLVRKGATEIVEELITHRRFFDTENDLVEWADKLSSKLGFFVSPTAQEEDAVREIFEKEIDDKIYHFFQEVQYGIFEKAFLVQKSLSHDKNI
mgnify:CR=1 FL=1